MGAKQIGSAVGAIVIVAAIMAGVKHAPSVMPEPASAAVDIHAPAQAAVGELVVLSVEDSDAKSFSWQIVPPTKHFMVIDNGRRAVFSSGTPGDYLFIVGAAKADAVDLKTHKLSVTTTVAPPEPAPAPAGDNLALKVAALAVSVDSPNKKAEAAKLAQVFASVSAAVNAGAISDPADIVAATKSATQTALGPNTTAWNPFLQGLQVELKARADAGKLSDARSHAETWHLIADALRAYSEAA